MTSSQAEALRACGRRLASSKSWWGAVPNEERSNTVIHVRPSDGGEWHVRVNDAVGFVAVPGFTLTVEPKIPIDHLLYLFGHSGEFPRLDQERLQIASGNSLHQLLAAWFVMSAERVLRADLIRDYAVQRNVQQFAKGTTHVVSTARAFYGGRIAIDCTYDDFLADNPSNRLLKAAARRVQSMAGLPVTIRRRAHGVVTRMDEVGELRQGDTQAGVERRSAHYRDALLLGRAVLKSAGFGWWVDEQDAWAFLIRTPEMVEAGLRAILAEAFGPERFVKRSLVLKGSALTMTPDLVAAGDRAVGDIKYKLTTSEWSRPDLYQVVAFAHAWDAERAAVSTFSDSHESKLPDLVVGGTPISHIFWNAAHSVAPDTARADWVKQINGWLTRTPCS